MARRILVATAAIAVALTVLHLERASHLVIDAPTWVDLPAPLGPEDKLLLDGDGQFFAMLAQDPTLARPEALHGVADHDAAFAYRAMRPAFGWAAWVLSAGQPSAVPWALIALTIASTVALAAGVMDLTRATGHQVEAAACVIVLPGVLHLLSWTGPEILCAACACAGTAAAVRRHHRQAAGWFTAAVLLRETVVLVVVALVIAHVWRSWWAATPLLALTAWVAVVFARVGAWPSGGARFALGGITDAAPEWDRNALAGLVLLGLLILCATVRHPLLTASLVLVHAALGAVMDEVVWSSDGFPRVFLPLYAILLALAGPWDSSHASRRLDQPLVVTRMGT